MCLSRYPSKVVPLHKEDAGFNPAERLSYIYKKHLIDKNDTF